MNIAVDVHVHASDLISLSRLDTGTRYLTVGSVTLFVSEEDLARIHAATAPVEPWYVQRLRVDAR